DQSTAATAGDAEEKKEEEESKEPNQKYATIIKKKKELGFLTLQWGLTATVDFESEKWRFLGKKRFDLQAAIEIAQATHYKARMYYKPIPGDEQRPPLDHQQILEQIVSPTTTTTTATATATTTETTTTATLATNQKTVENNDNDNNNSNNNDNTETQQQETKEEKKSEEKQVECNENNEDGDWWVKLPSNHHQPPKGWVRIEGEFGLVIATNINALGGYPFGGNTLKRNDGTLLLIYSTRISRLGAISMFGEIEKAEHLKNKSIFAFRTRELVLEPLETKPLMNFDGERRPLLPTFVKVLPQRAMVACQTQLISLKIFRALFHYFYSSNFWFSVTFCCLSKLDQVFLLAFYPTFFIPKLVLYSHYFCNKKRRINFGKICTVKTVLKKN
ncbi:hypothetical protein RFI_26264, partial [Reticulomyxa filosa]